MISMKQIPASLVISVFLLLLISPLSLPSGTVTAQTNGYTITNVNHQVQVMYSGHIAILDSIHVLGQLPENFLVGLPSKYSAYVLKGFAYDSTNVYQLNLGVQLSQSGFYGVEVDFNGNSPSEFTIAFVLSNGLITDQGQESLTLDFPAYPSLPQDADTCQVSLSFPSSPLSLSITKEDGNTNNANYVRNNLPAYTYSVASAEFQVPTGTLQLTTISSLNRQITIDPNGKVSATDSYRITGNSSTSISSYVISLPVEATNVVVSDQFGGELPTTIPTSASGDILLANVTLFSFLNNGQSTTLLAKYTLPNTKIEGSKYILKDFKLFPELSYYVNQATIIFTPPEGATIVSPHANQLTSTSSLTRGIYQDTLSVTKNGVSYVDYLTTQQNDIEFSYEYNPVWVAFRPTFWAAFAALVGCIALLLYRKRQPKEETYASRVEQISSPKTTSQQSKSLETKQGQHVTTEDVKSFLDAYEDREQLKAEVKSMDLKAQKGKIPRRQYKVQRKAIENRIDNLSRTIDRKRQTFIASSSTYSDFARQLDLAEEDLGKAEENIKTLEQRQNKGEISIETFKKNAVDYQKQKDKAEAAINGILLRLREKTR